MFMHLQQKYKKRQNKPTVKRDTRGDVQKNTWCHTRVFLQFLRAGFTPELHGYVFKAAVCDNVLFLFFYPHTDFSVWQSWTASPLFLLP